MFDGKGDAVNFASDMEKAKFFGKEGDEPIICDEIAEKGTDCDESVPFLFCERGVVRKGLDVQRAFF